MISHVIFIRPAALRVTMAALMVVSGTISSYMNNNNNNNKNHNGNSNVTGALIYVTSDESNGSTAIVVVSDGEVGSKQAGFGEALGDPCSDHCSDNLTHAVCNDTTGRCECESTHPIRLDNFICIPGLHLGEICIHEKSCEFHDPNSWCFEESPFFSKCGCKVAFIAIENRGRGRSKGEQKCVPQYTNIHYDMSALLGIGVGLSLFTGITCLMLKLFSRARFGNVGGHYADANQSPPMLMTPVSGPPSRRSSGRSGGSRRPSYYSTLAPLSRPGSRRPSMVSVRSQGSIHSYTAGRYDHGHHHHHHHHHHNHHQEDHRHYPKQHQHQGHGRVHHEPLRATMSAPIVTADFRNDVELGSPSGSSIVSVRMLEQRFAQHSSYHPRREDRETSRHNSQEIITDVISESPEKSYKI